MPIVTIDPSRGGPAGGTQVIIQGSGFTGATAVTFDGVAGTDLTVFSDNIIVVTTPAHAVGAVDVTADVGGTLAGGFTYARAIDAVVEVGAGNLGGQPLTIQGVGFTGATQVKIGGIAATDVVVVDDNTVTCTTPAHASGAVDVEVVGVATLVGGLAISRWNFQFRSLPALGGAILQDLCALGAAGFCGVGGSGLVVTSPDGLTWTKRTASAANGWRGVAFAPTLGTGAGRLVAVASSGTDRVMTSDDGGVTWTARTAATAVGWQSVAWAPELTLFVAVASSGTAGVSRVMTSPDGISWTSRTASSETTWTGVAWSAALTLFAAVSAGGAIMTSPDGTTWTARTSAAGCVPGGSSSGSSVIAWSPVAGVFAWGSRNGSTRGAVTSPDGTTWTERAIPSSAEAIGGTAAWRDGLMLPRQGGTLRINTSANGTTWVAESAQVAGGVLSQLAWSEPLSTVVIWHDAGTPQVLYGLLADDPVAGLTLVSVDPPNGPEIGGTPVTLTGTGFETGALVNFGNFAPETGVVVVSDTEITCETPPHPVGLVDVTVTNPDFAFATLADGFEYLPEDAVGITPTHGPIVGGTAVTITGTGFINGYEITFDGILATDVVWVDDTEMTCVTPPHSAGPVEVIVGSNAAPGDRRSVGTFTYDPIAASPWQPPGGGGSAFAAAIRRSPEVAISRAKNRPAASTFEVGAGDAPLAGQVVQVDLTEGVIFEGPALTVAETYEGRPDQLKRSLTVGDDAWIMNARRPLGTWTGVSATVVIRETFRDYAPSDFDLTNVADDLPTVSIDFDGSQTFADCLDATAKAAASPFSWYLDGKAVHAFVEEAATEPAEIVDGLPSLQNDPPITKTVDVSQIRNRAYGRGAGTTVAVAAYPGSSVMEVNDLKPFERTGGLAIAKGQVFAYAGTRRVAEAVARPTAPSGGGDFLATWDVGSHTPDGNVRDIVHYRVTFVDPFGLESSPSPVAEDLFPPPQVSGVAGGLFTEVPGAGEMPLGSFTYIVTGITNGGETAPPQGVAIVGVATTAPGSAFDIELPVIGADPLRVIQRGVYRTRSVDPGVPYQRFFRVATSDGNAPGVVVRDAFADESLQDENVNLETRVVVDPRTGQTVTTHPRNTTGVVAKIRNLPQLRGFTTGPGTESGVAPTYDGTTDDVTIDGEQLEGTNVISIVKAGDPAPIAAGMGIQIAGAEGTYVVGSAQPSVTTSPGVTIGIFISPPLRNDLVGGEAVTISGYKRRLYREQSRNPGVWRMIQEFGNDETGEVVDDEPTDPPGLYDVVGPEDPDVVSATGGGLPGALPPIMHLLLVGIPTSGPRSIRKTIPEDAPVNIWLQEDDVPAQAFLAARLGGDGVRETTIEDTSKRTAALRDRLRAELTLFSMPIESVAWATTDPNAREGRTQRFNLVDPPIAGSFLIQSVDERRIHAEGGPGPSAPSVKSVTASSVRFTLDDLLDRALLKGEGEAPGRGSGAVGGGSSARNAVDPAPLTVVVASGANLAATVTGEAGSALLTPVTVTLSWEGVLAPARGGTGTDTSGALDGEVLVGRSSDHTWQRGKIADAHVASGAAIALAKLAEPVIQADGGQAWTADQPLAGHRITFAGNPVNPQDYVTKAYVDGGFVPSGGGGTPFVAGPGLTLSGGVLAVGAGRGITVDADTVSIRTYTSILTNGDPISPEVMFDSFGDVIVAEVPY